MTDKLKVATKVLRQAPPWLVNALTLILIPACVTLAWLYFNERIGRERAEAEARFLREQNSDLKVTLGTERAVNHYASMVVHQ